ncbi:glycosyltransferase family 2 protein [Luxibacter massiliensis]|uniref:glycosyltransferase family 2 protein n=1 Tax=Luxibacter massiliensis TaxID=2219695 RepID=UPI000F0512A6|nr:glycosyltransferase family 2 protein [Luxibacter massiliensis]
MEKISFVIACYNEVDNIKELVERITTVMYKEHYEYEIIFADNASSDGTQEVLRQLAEKEKCIKVILNNRNYGPTKSPRNAMGHVSGDVVIGLAADLQDPPELIPEFIREWEKGYKLVYGQKLSSDEGFIKHGLRSLYYNIIDLFSEIPQYKHLSGITLHARDVLTEMLSADPDIPFRYLIAEMGYPVKLIPYNQNKRKSGKSSYNISKYFNFAMNSLISTSTIPLRVATVFGCFMVVICFIIGIVYLVMKLLHWNQFSIGTAPMLIGVFFLGSVQIVFIGLVGEYVGAISRKLTKQMPVIEKELINFDKE